MGEVYDLIWLPGLDFFEVKEKERINKSGIRHISPSPWT